MQIIGEAATKLSDDVLARYPGVPWRQIRRFRTLITHEYHKVDAQTLWDTLEKDIPSLVAILSDESLGAEQS